MGQVANILHISDLHYTRGGERYNQGIVLKALEKDLAVVCQEKLRPDVIAITGDVANAGDDDSIYYEWYESVLEPILKITRCNERRVFLCPGNHDAQRKVVRQQMSRQRLLLERLLGRDALNETYLKGDLTEFSNERFGEFREITSFVRNDTPVWDDGFLRCDYVDGLPIDVMSLNTAWITQAGLDGSSDYGRLLFPEAALQKAGELARPGHIVLYLSHHPFSWLAEFSQADAENLLKGNGHQATLHLFGHAHEPRPQHVVGPRGKCLSSQSGALYIGRGRYNGYSVISFEIEDPHPVVNLRSYFDRPKQFDKAVDVCPGDDGRFFSSDESRRFWHRFSRRIERAGLSRWLDETYLGVAAKDYNEGIVDRSVGDIFVPPPLYLNSELINDEEGLPQRIETPITFGAVVTSSSNYIFFGKEEYGKTTLLQQIALKLIKFGASDQTQSQVPVLIRFDDILPGHEPVQRALRRSLLAELPEGLTFASLLDEGLVTVLIDDVCFSDRRRWLLLRDFITKFSKNRFIFSALELGGASSPVLFAEDLAVNTATPVIFENVFLRPFTRHKMRSLVEKWNPDHHEDTEKTLNRLTHELAGMQIPLTAVNGSILLTIYEDSSGGTLVNRATLIDRFVEHALEKRSPREALRGAFDYKNKVHVLSEISKHMAFQDNYVLPASEFDAVVRAYLDRVGLDQEVEPLTRLFIEAKILARRSDGCLSFRYRAFLEYFTAYQMQVDPDFRGWVLDDKQYLRFCNEIQYYAGLQRQDVELLGLIGGRFKDLSLELAREAEWDFDVRRLDTFLPPGPDDDDTDLFENISRQLESPPLSEEERDEVLEAELPQDVEGRQEVFRPSYTHTGQRWTAALFIYSGILKNLDLIGKGLKQQHLSEVLKGWGVFTLQGLFAVPMIALHRRIRINGVAYEVLVPRYFTNKEVARLLYMEYPQSFSQLVFHSLGTEKLSRQLKEPDLEESSEPLIVQFFRHTLIVDLRLPGWPEALPRFIRTVQKSRYLCEATLRKMSNLYVIGGHDARSGEKLKGLIGEAIALLRDGRGKSRSGTKSAALQALDKKALLRRLRISAQEKADSVGED